MNTGFLVGEIPRTRRTGKESIFQNVRPIRDGSIRVELVACVVIWRNHVEAMTQHKEDAELCAVCDIDERALLQAKAVTGAGGYRDLSSVLAKERPDAVILATPIGLHCEQAIQSAAS